MRYEKLIAGVIILGGLHGMTGADARADGFGKIPEQGCPMSHCDPQMSDQVILAAPTGATVTKVKESSTTTTGETRGTDGLGCVGDGEMAFCTYRGPGANPGNLVAYDYDLVSPWDSGPELDSAAYASMPLIRQNASGGNGNVIAVDSVRIIEFDRSTGIPQWDQDLISGGLPTGPLITQNGGIVFATLDGPGYLFDGNNSQGAPGARF